MEIWQAEQGGLESRSVSECCQEMIVAVSFVVCDFVLVDYVSFRHSELPRTNAGEL